MTTRNFSQFNLLRYSSRVAALILFSVAITACTKGGGSPPPPPISSSSASSGSNSSASSTSSASSNSTSSTSQTSSASSTSSSSTGNVVINPGFSGTVYVPNTDGTLEIDVATGVAHLLHRIDNRLGESERLSANIDGSEFAYYSYAPSNQQLGMLRITGRNGLTTQSFTLSMDSVLGLSGDVLLSPDGRYLMVRYSDDAHLADTGEFATVFDRQGNLIKRYTGYPFYAWLPDGRVVLAKDDSIYIGDKSFGDPVLLKQIPGKKPNFLSPSPDGRSLAFVLDSAGFKNTATGSNLNMIELDGTGLRQVAVADLGVEGAAWSPDSQHLMVRTSMGGFVCSDVWIIPAHASNTINISHDTLNQAIPFWQRLDDIDLKDQLCVYTVPQWRTQLPPLPSNEGTIPGTAGINAGLTGRLWTKLSPNYGLINLMTGTGVRFGNTGDYAYPSFDASEVAYFNLIESSFNIADYNRNLHSQFIKSDAQLSTTPMLSPNGNRMAAEYHSINDGSGRVVNIFGRDGTTLKRMFNNASEWVWHPNGSLLMVIGQDIYQLPADLSTPTVLARFNDPVHDLAINPAGTKLAFEMGGNIWTSNLDGSNLKQMTLSLSVNKNPAWSPDGKWLAFTHDNLIGLPTCDVVHVIPADGERIRIGADWYANNDITISYIENGAERDMCAFSKLGWFAP